MSQLSLLTEAEPKIELPAANEKADMDLGQVFTPFWAARALVEHYFPELCPNHHVMEPTCGPGAFLSALPDDVPAFGVEVDQSLAQQARHNTSRTILNKDVLTHTPDNQPTHIIGNPPFATDFIDRLVNYAYKHLPAGGRMGLILPSYVWQTPNRLADYNRKFSVSQTSLPRTIFQGLSIPITFGIFEKDKTKALSGFFLYSETLARDSFATVYKNILKANSGRIWQSLVETALINLGGRATLKQLYTAISPHRPLTNNFFRQKVRQTCRQYFPKVARGEFALAA